jgi:hypothetical protein
VRSTVYTESVECPNCNETVTVTAECCTCIALRAENADFRALYNVASAESARLRAALEEIKGIRYENHKRDRDVLAVIQRTVAAALAPRTGGEEKP